MPPSSERLIHKEENSNSLINPIKDIGINICSCPKILIVDDEIGNRKVISNYCNRLNINSEEAINGLEALEKVENFLIKYSCCPNYILILMDSNMPMMNGEESSLKIRSFIKNQGQGMPIIICITANATNYKEDFPNSLTIYDELYYKPLTFGTFKSIVQHYNL